MKIVLFDCESLDALIVVSGRCLMATTANATDLAGAMHRPKAFVVAALHFGWLPNTIVRDLIQLIAAYACTRGM